MLVLSTSLPLAKVLDGFDQCNQASAVHCSKQQHCQLTSATLRTQKKSWERQESKPGAAGREVRIAIHVLFGPSLTQYFVTPNGSWINCKKGMGFVLYHLGYCLCTEIVEIVLPEPQRAPRCWWDRPGMLRRNHSSKLSRLPSTDQSSGKVQT